jgi:hypothetical protein
VARGKLRCGGGWDGVPREAAAVWQETLVRASQWAVDATARRLTGYIDEWSIRADNGSFDLRVIVRLALTCATVVGAAGLIGALAALTSS